MLHKRKLDDGGIDVATGLFGPAVFLDVWAVRELSRDASSQLAGRFATALTARMGSLLVSSALVTELEPLKGDARTRAQALFTSLGEHWLLINPVVSTVAAREARDDLGAYLSDASLKGFIKDRCGELLRADIDPHSLSDAEFFDLGRVFVWTTVEQPSADEPNGAIESPSVSSADDRPNGAITGELQGRALKDAAKARADADTAEQRRDRGACDRLYPSVPFTSGRLQCVYNAVWREVTRRSLGRTWMPNDGFDVTHLIPALTIGGFIAVDTDWQSIGQTAACDLPPNHAKLYRPGELEELVADLEA